ncbi:phospholipase D-like protein [Thermosporothrix hazakensis]|jgi:hypothetical protein|uniref:Phospholipase D-like protein n=1 Tax=Thermosporothrix hazakensis TaxID=644383 RepID=A0A326UFY7_THEHA|nr:PLD nuclease N-terminal domain-containing protein [Thermosporothrix hazakensis]PZW29503.1 phospholipase D-like protein [Thermosporothrix hazakensis]GCE45782.1 hypothetical protein KTH_06510 [Thermosporothrix hazakensis]
MFPFFFDFAGRGASWIWVFLSIWATVDCARRLRNEQKIFWIVLIWLIPWGGTFLYIFWGRRLSGQRTTPPVETPQYTPVNTAHYYKGQEQSREERSYEQGYVPVEPKEAETYWQRYEEPMASYPEAPHEQEMMQQQRQKE